MMVTGDCAPLGQYDGLELLRVKATSPGYGTQLLLVTGPQTTSPGHRNPEKSQTIILRHSGSTRLVAVQTNYHYQTPLRAFPTGFSASGALSMSILETCEQNIALDEVADLISTHPKSCKMSQFKPSGADRPVNDPRITPGRLLWLACSKLSPLAPQLDKYSIGLPPAIWLYLVCISLHARYKRDTTRLRGARRSEYLSI